MSKGAADILDVMLSKIEAMARAKTVLGEPVQMGDRMVIPVVKISVGFGAGGSEATSQKESKPAQAGGGGGGGGFCVQPVGFIVMDEERTSFLPVKQKSVGSLIEMIPNLMEKIAKAKGKKKVEEKEVEAEVEGE